MKKFKIVTSRIVLNLFFLTFFLLISAAASAEVLLSLQGIPSQGALIFGTVSADVKQVNMNGEKLLLNENKFIYGFDRDEKLEHQIELIFEDHFHILKFEIASFDYEIQEITRVEKKYVIPPADPFTANRIKLETNTLKLIRKQMKENIFFYADSVFIRPVEKGWISSKFGGQRIINGVPQKPHNGLDIAVPKGTEIKAMTSGIVTLIGDYFYNGKFVLIDHGYNLSSIYLHMSEITVKRGDFVRTGTKIGEVGSSGRSTGNHLHWGINWRDKNINPSLILEPQDEFLVFRSEVPEFDILAMLK